MDIWLVQEYHLVNINGLKIETIHWMMHTNYTYFSAIWICVHLQVRTFGHSNDPGIGAYHQHAEIRGMASHPKDGCLEVFFMSSEVNEGHDLWGSSTNVDPVQSACRHTHVHTRTHTHTHTHTHTQRTHTHTHTHNAHTHTHIQNRTRSGVVSSQYIQLREHTGKANLTYPKHL